MLDLGDPWIDKRVSIRAKRRNLQSISFQFPCAANFKSRLILLHPSASLAGQCQAQSAENLPTRTFQLCRLFYIDWSRPGIKTIGGKFVRSCSPPPFSPAGFSFGVKNSSCAARRNRESDGLLQTQRMREYDPIVREIPVPWPCRPPAIETSPCRVPTGPPISWHKIASCSRIRPRASRASLPPRIGLWIILHIHLFSKVLHWRRRVNPDDPCICWIPVSCALHMRCTCAGRILFFFPACIPSLSSML